MPDPKYLERQRDEMLSRIESNTTDISQSRSKLTLSQKILRITKAASVVERRGVNAEEGYKYAKVEDILDAVRNLMDKQGVILTGSVWERRSGQDPALPHVDFHATAKGCVRDVVVCWTLQDVRSREKQEFHIPGSGWDYGDKGTYKALTGSRKYALIFIFNLRIADEPEEFGYVDREEAAARAQDVARKKLAEKAESPDSEVRAIAKEGLKKLDAKKEVQRERVEQGRPNSKSTDAGEAVRAD